MAAVSGTNFSADPDTAEGEVGPAQLLLGGPLPLIVSRTQFEKKNHPLFCTDLSTLYFFSLNYN